MYCRVTKNPTMGFFVRNRISNDSVEEASFLTSILCSKLVCLELVQKEVG